VKSAAEIAGEIRWKNPEIIAAIEWANTPEGKAEIEAKELAEAEERRQVEERQREERIWRNLASAGCPKRIRDAIRAGNVRETPAVAKMRSWCKSDDWCLVLSGPKGVGKSLAAGLWLRESGAAYGIDSLPRWWPATEVACVDGYSDKARAICEMPGPLVLDDLGCEYADAKGFFHQRLDRLIDWRYRECLPLLITTNLSPEDFAKRYGERVRDRLREGGQWFGVGGQSLRGGNG
jgi:hypothetical protein